MICATCGGIDGHYPWCAVGQLNADVAELTEAVAAKDRRIAELETALKEWGLLADHLGLSTERHRKRTWNTLANNGQPALDALLAQAKREALEEAAQYFAAVDSWSGWAVFSELRRMAREVKP